MVSIYSTVPSHTVPYGSERVRSGVWGGADFRVYIQTILRPGREGPVDFLSDLT